MKSIVLVVALLAASQVFAIDNLKLNPKLDYGSDSLDGPLITGEDAASGLVGGRTNYVIIYGEGCFNSKRQARRTVELYGKFRDQVHFVVIDLDQKLAEPQQELVKRYYQGSIPHVVVLDGKGKALYNAAGEVESEKISGIFEHAR